MTGNLHIQTFSLIGALALMLAACSSSDAASEVPTTAELSTTSVAASAPRAGPLTIVTEADFSNRPVVGTFEVTEGADVLGCSSGTFVDEFVAADSVHKIMTCTSGSNEDTFTIDFDPSGPWSVVEPSGDFVGLQGSGDFSAVEAVETFTGDIEYAS